MNFTSTACQVNTDFLNTLSNLPNCIVDSFFSYLVSGLIGTVQGFIDASFKFLFSSPDPKLFCSPYNAVLSVLEGLFSLAMMALALMFITRSNDVEGRIASKAWLESMLVMIILLSFSFPLFQLGLDLNTHLSTSFASDSMKSAFSPSGSFTSAIFALLILLLVALLLILTFITLLLRYILIPFLLLLFPIAIFLYFTPLTQSWGKAFLKLIATIVFMTTLDALIILGLGTLFNSNDPNLADALVRAFAILFGFGAIGVINALLFVSSFLSLVTQSKTASAAIGFSVLKSLKR